MKPNPQFQRQPKSFWAHVRSIGQALGYTVRGAGLIKTPSAEEMRQALHGLGLKSDQLIDFRGAATPFGQTLVEYFRYRVRVLNTVVEPQLMDVGQAAKLFAAYKKRLRPSCPIPMNKQKGKKKTEAYFTGLVNMLIEAHAERYSCDYDPRALTTITANGAPLRTLARRIDGAFPRVVNPIAVWEIKEYYHTTTFGSRVADGVYETLLDGMELEELKEHEGIHVKHYLMVDAHYTWWECGKSYLCRIIDMLHMGYVDEVLFGKEVVAEMPRIVREWVAAAKAAGE